MPCEHLYCWRSSESQGHAKPFLWQQRPTSKAQGGTEPRSWAHSSSCARARLDLCELCNFCATSASGDSPITDRAIGHRSTTRPASRSALSSPVQLGHGRSAQLHQHTPALMGWTLRFCVWGHAPARATCIARAQESDAAVAWPEPAVMPLSHAPLAGVAWAASIVSPDSAARVSTQN